MEEGVTDPSSSSDTKPKKFYEIFEEVFPYYLTLGMSAHQFWDEEASLVKAYREAKKIAIREANFDMWLQGRYIYRAVVTAIANTFGDAQGKALEYPDRPDPLLKEDIEAENERRQMEKMYALQDYIRRQNQKSLKNNEGETK